MQDEPCKKHPKKLLTSADSVGGLFLKDPGLLGLQANRVQEFSRTTYTYRIYRYIYIYIDDLLNLFRLLWKKLWRNDLILWGARGDFE